MFVSTVTCRFDLHRGTFDDTPLRAVSWDKDLLSVRDHFFVVGDVPHLAFVLVYRLVPPSHPDGSSGRSPYPPGYPGAWPGPWPPGPAWPAQAGSGPGAQAHVAAVPTALGAAPVADPGAAYSLPVKAIRRVGRV